MCVCGGGGGGGPQHKGASLCGDCQEVVIYVTVLCHLMTTCVKLTSSAGYWGNQLSAPCLDQYSSGWGALQPRWWISSFVAIGCEISEALVFYSLPTSATSRESMLSFLRENRFFIKRDLDSTVLDSKQKSYLAGQRDTALQRENLKEK